MRKFSGGDAEVNLIYDVSHNIAKIEDHRVHGVSVAAASTEKSYSGTRGDHPELASRFSGVGQPVLVPGDMGTASWVLRTRLE